MCANMVQSTDVREVFCSITNQWPGLGNLFFFDKQETCTQWHTHPFVQRCSVVVAVQFTDFVLDVGKGMCAIHHHLNTFAVCHVAYFSDRQYLSGDVDHMGNHQELGFGGNCFLIQRNNFLIGSRKIGDRNLVQYNPISFGHLFKHIQH